MHSHTNTDKHPIHTAIAISLSVHILPQLNKGWKAQNGNAASSFYLHSSASKEDKLFEYKAPSFVKSHSISHGATCYVTLFTKAEYCFESFIANKFILETVLVAILPFLFERFT